jgi:hypothetical protein
MAHSCGSCGKLEAPPGGQFCETCRVRLILAGMVELALPGEITPNGFVPYIELRRAERVVGVEPERRDGIVLYPSDVVELERMLNELGRHPEKPAE